MGIVGELFAFCYQQAPLRQVNQAGIPAKGQKPRDFCLAGIKATSVSLPPDSFFSKFLKIHGLRTPIQTPRDKRCNLACLRV